MLKWVVFAIGLACVLPLSHWLRNNPKHHPKVWAILGFFPFILNAFPFFNISLIPWPWWPGIVKGLQITALDLLVLALYLALPRSRQPLPFRLPMALYFFAAMLSVVSANVPMAAIFYVWQLVRVYFVYLVAARACADERVIPSILKGMAAGLLLQAVLAVVDRGSGVVQTGGSFGHQNMLGLVSHFVVFPFLALLLAGERGWWPILTPIFGTVVAVLTASRATLGLGGLGYVLTFMLSSLRQWTSRKAMLLLIGVVAISIITPVALSSLEVRFTTTSNIEAYDERAALITAAELMLADHPMGIGANNFATVNNVSGYAVRAGVAWNWGSRSSQVHNIYWLTAAEMGYVGIVTLVTMLLGPLIAAFRCGWRNRGDLRGDLLLGMAVALLVVYIHSYFEWILLFFQTQYILAMIIGMIAGLTQQLGYWRRAGAHGNHHNTLNPSTAPGRRTDLRMPSVNR